MEIKDITPGTPVIYWAHLNNDGTKFHPKKTVIESAPWTLRHGELVCNVAGIVGAVSIRHLNPITTGSLVEAYGKGCNILKKELAAHLELEGKGHRLLKVVISKDPPEGTWCEGMKGIKFLVIDKGVPWYTLAVDADVNNYARAIAVSYCRTIEIFENK